MNTAYPNFRAKHAEEALFSPTDYIEYIKRRGGGIKGEPPVGVILCYQRQLMEHILSAHPTSKAEGAPVNMVLLDDAQGKIGVVGKFGIGAPAAVVALEELIACGIKRFISIGTAGTLQKNIDIGHLLVCERAIRDEGTSHHYLPPGKYAEASPGLTTRFSEALAKMGQAFHLGTSWTIDTPYRETVAEARHYQAEGVATVEMEASALFAVAQHRGAELASAFTISDSLADLKWRPEFHSSETQVGLETLYTAAKAALLHE